MSAPFTVEAVYENGVFRPLHPLPVEPPPHVTLVVQASGARKWPADAPEIYQAIAEEDRRLAEQMFRDVGHTWPVSKETP